MANSFFSPKNIFLFLIILLFLPSIINIFRLILTTISYREVNNDLKNGKLTEAIENFPVHKTSLDAYVKSKDKIDNFIELLSKDKSTELILSQKELNDLCRKGKIVNKYISGKYVYYEIKENKIVENLIEGPFILPPNPYFTRTKEIYFSANKLEQYFKIIEENGKKINYQTPPHSLDSPLILFILGVSETPDKFPFKFRKSSEHLKGLVLLNKLKNVEIKNNNLVLKS